MIVNESESLEIGGTIIPMHEILDKIRLKKGGIVEQDLGNRLQIQRKQESLEVLFKRLKESEDRFWELERALSITKEGQGPDEFGGQIREHAELSKIMDDYQEYKYALKQIDEEMEILDAENQREKVSEKINTLEQKKDALEKELKKFVASRMPEDMESEDISLLEELDKLDKRFIELEKDIGASEVNENDEEFQKKVRERASLRKIIAGYDVYRQITKEVEEKKTLLKKDEEQIKKSVQTRLDALRIKRDDIENSLKIRLMPDEGLAVYGIYVVRSGDNIWNIHFRFLKEYFKTRDINISSSADEPIRPGMSSGIGKILKFSENMVYIYNLREHQLSMNLNIIHPLSKIVVFNMGQAFELLNKIDYESIRHIHFDGENIWIPAEQ